MSVGPEGTASRRYLLAAGLWLAAIFFLTLWPRPPEILPDLPSLPGADKATHALLYAVEGWLLVRSARPRPLPGARIGRLALAVALALIPIALVNEALQWLVPPRTPEWGDFVADVVGGAVGAWLAGGRRVDGR
jgi:VanZ family protein